MIISTVSLNQIWENKEENILLCEEYIKNASLQKVDLIVFPEMTLTGFSTNISNISEDEEDSETIKKFKSLAKSYNIAILFGLVISNGIKALNKTFFIDENGCVLGKYTKIHPFSFSGEDKYFNPGTKLEIIKYKTFNIALTICYDLRFPELYSSLSKKSDLIINMANWPKKRLEHWNTLLKARAIENQVFIAGINRIGTDGNNLEYEESTNIFNCNGDLVKFKKFNDMKIFNINKDFTKEFKQNFNTTNDRKVNFYKGII